MGYSWCGSDQWGPFEDNDNLTKCFLDSVVMGVPLAGFAIFAVHRLATIEPARTFNASKFDTLEEKEDRKTFVSGGEVGHSHVTGNSLIARARKVYLTKLAVCSMLVFFNLLIALNRIRDDDDADEDFSYRVVMPIFTMVAWALAMTITYVEYSRIRYSNVLQGFVCASIFAAAWKLRVDIDRTDYDDDVVWGTDMILFIIYFALLLAITSLSFVTDDRNLHVHDLEKDDKNKEQEDCPELTASLFFLLTFSWASALMELGYTRPLEMVDMWKLRPGDRSAAVYKRMSDNWMKSTPSLTKAIWHTFGAYYSRAAIFKLIHDSCQFAGPIILGLLVEFIDEPDKSISDGYLYVLILAIAACVQTLALHQYFHICFRTGMLLRGAIASSVYQKSLVLSGKSRQASETGNIVNLMTVDAQRFMEVTPYLHMVWSSVFQITVALYLLYDVVGISLLSGVAVMVVSIPLNAVMGKKLRAINMVLLKCKDARTKAINEVLNGIKVLKLYAWEKPVVEQVREVRERELTQLKYSKYFNAMMGFFWSSTPVLVTVATFLTYVSSDKELTAAKAFQAVALFNILRFPLVMFPQMLAALIEVSASIERLQKFLLLEEVDPDAVTRGASKRQKNNDNNNNSNDNAKAIVIKNAHFSWLGEEANILLHNINLEVGARELVAVVGQVGSGKSSLISALNGDMFKHRFGYDTQGFVGVSGSVAYVAQQAWIINATLRDNITFGKPYREDFYKTVVQKCELLADFSMLPSGDQTEIGEKGINLSGGQKQRVSIARAVYQQADVYLLDDPLSALDAHVATNIFENVIGPRGILNDTCRVLVTHGINFLSECTNVACIEKGHIVEYGTFKELVAKNGVLASLVNTFNSTMQAASKPEPQDLLVDVPPLTTPAAASSSSSSASSTTTPTKAASPTTTTLSVPAPGAAGAAKAAGGSKLVVEEERSFGSVDASVYKLYLHSVGRFFTTVVLLAMLFYQVSSVGANIWLSIWTSKVSDEEYLDYGEDDKKVDQWYYVGIYSGISGGQCFLVLLSSYVVALAGLASARRIHDSMLTTVVRAPMSFFDTTPVGRILNRFGKDQYMVDDMLPRTISTWLGTMFQVAGVLVAIAIATPYFIMMMIPLALVYHSVQVYYLRASRELKRMEAITRSPLYSHFTETLTGTSTIRAYGFQKMFTDDNYSKLDQNQMAYYPGIVANRWLATRLEFVGTFIVTFAALFAVLERGNIDPGMVGLSLSYALSMTQTLNWMVRSSCEVETNIVSVERTKEYSELKTEAAAIIPDRRPPANWPTRGVVEFRNVQLRYRDGLPLVLKGLNIKIGESEKMGICGRTGAGKSSFALALFRLVESCGGQILIDGIDISTIGLEDLRSRLSIIPQDPVLFAGTLRYNLDPFGDHTDEQLWASLANSHLAEAIKKLDGKLDAKVSENGENFSVGQRQLICLARALLRNSKVLVLDEATSSIDVETDSQVQETIRKQFAHCTVITVAHRLNTLTSGDRICVMSDGAVVELGTPQELTSRKSLFQDMLDSLKNEKE